MRCFQVKVHDCVGWRRRIHEKNESIIAAIVENTLDWAFAAKWIFPKEEHNMLRAFASCSSMVTNCNSMLTTKRLIPFLTSTCRCCCYNHCYHCVFFFSGLHSHCPCTFVVEYHDDDDINGVMSEAFRKCGEKRESKTLYLLSFVEIIKYHNFFLFWIV